MKSFIGNSSSVRGWALLLTLLLGAGMMISACGDEEVPAPTTPAPPPAPPPAPEPEPEPEPTPEPPATPTGLHVDETTATSITWHWSAVEGALGYAVQVSMDEMFDDTDEIAITTETHFTATPVPPETSVYLRVRSGTGTPEALAAAVATGSLEGLLLSDWSTHVTGMTTAVPLPPAPANLRVKERGSDFIEWEWDAVDGVDGYQSQFSTSSDFSDSPTEFHQGMNMTSRKVSNLDAESDGYLRVRTYTGTLADHTVGMWSEGLMSSTTEPPPAVPLAAPTGLEATDTDDDSITLEWDSVRNADTYEVEQREPGDDWEDASCGGGDNVVDDEECVASDLSEGTDYDFRVRAVPADDDTAYLTSAWSDIEETRTSGTAAPEPTAPVGGGMGALNVRWTSSSAGIEWTWDRLADKTYDYVILSGAALPRMDAENPCADVDYPDATSGVAATDADMDIATALLCVRTTNARDTLENLSFAWAVKPPATAPTVGSASPATTSGMATRSLTWGAIGVTGGFSYEIKTVADPERDNRITATVPAAGSALQRTCDSGTLLESDETDVDLTGLETTLTGVQPYTGYLLCYRMLNSSGATDWVAPASNAEHYTAPATAPRATKDGSRSVDDRTTATERIVWNVTTRNTATVPRLQTGYNIYTISHASRNDNDDTDTLHNNNVVRPRAVDCGDADFQSAPYTRTEITDATPTSQGFSVTINPSRPTTAVPVRTTGTTDEILPDVISLCVQATYGTDIVGPWSISSAETIEKANE